MQLSAGQLRHDIVATHVAAPIGSEPHSLPSGSTYAVPRRAVALPPPPDGAPPQLQLGATIDATSTFSILLPPPPQLPLGATLDGTSSTSGFLPHRSEAPPLPPFPAPPIPPFPTRARDRQNSAPATLDAVATMQGDLEGATFSSKRTDVSASAAEPAVQSASCGGSLKGGLPPSDASAASGAEQIIHSASRAAALDGELRMLMLTSRGRSGLAMHVIGDVLPGGDIKLVEDAERLVDISLRKDAHRALQRLASEQRERQAACREAMRMYSGGGDEFKEDWRQLDKCWQRLGRLIETAQGAGMLGGDTHEAWRALAPAAACRQRHEEAEERAAELEITATALRAVADEEGDQNWDIEVGDGREGWGALVRRARQLESYGQTKEALQLMATALQIDSAGLDASRNAPKSLHRKHGAIDSSVVGSEREQLIHSWYSATAHRLKATASDDESQRRQLEDKRTARRRHLEEVQRRARELEEQGRSAEALDLMVAAIGTDDVALETQQASAAPSAKKGLDTSVSDLERERLKALVIAQTLSQYLSIVDESEVQKLKIEARIAARQKRRADMMQRAKELEQEASAIRAAAATDVTRQPSSPSGLTSLGAGGVATLTLDTSGSAASEREAQRVAMFVKEVKQWRQNRHGADSASATQGGDDDALCAVARLSVLSRLAARCKECRMACNRTLERERAALAARSSSGIQSSTGVARQTLDAMLLQHFVKAWEKIEAELLEDIGQVSLKYSKVQGHTPTHVALQTSSALKDDANALQRLVGSRVLLEALAKDRATELQRLEWAAERTLREESASEVEAIEAWRLWVGLEELHALHRSARHDTVDGPAPLGNNISDRLEELRLDEREEHRTRLFEVRARQRQREEDARSTTGRAIGVESDDAAVVAAKLPSQIRGALEEAQLRLGIGWAQRDRLEELRLDELGEQDEVLRQARLRRALRKKKKYADVDSVAAASNANDIAVEEGDALEEIVKNCLGDKIATSALWHQFSLVAPAPLDISVSGESSSSQLALERARGQLLGLPGAAVSPNKAIAAAEADGRAEVEAMLDAVQARAVALSAFGRDLIEALEAAFARARDGEENDKESLEAEVAGIVQRWRTRIGLGDAMTQGSGEGTPGDVFGASAQALLAGLADTAEKAILDVCAGYNQELDSKSVSQRSKCLGDRESEPHHVADGAVRTAILNAWSKRADETADQEATQLKQQEEALEAKLLARRRQRLAASADKASRLSSPPAVLPPLAVTPPPTPLTVQAPTERHKSLGWGGAVQTPIRQATEAEVWAASASGEALVAQVLAHIDEEAEQQAWDLERRAEERRIRLSRRNSTPSSSDEFPPGFCSDSGASERLRLPPLRLATASSLRAKTRVVRNSMSMSALVVRIPPREEA